MQDKEKEDSQWDNWLIEAVRKIRAQKQRPGIDRIYNAVRLLAEKEQQAEQTQKSPIAPIYQVAFQPLKIEKVQRHLDRTVRKGILFRVLSKGQTAYKTVENCDRKLHLHSAPEENLELTKVTIRCLKELLEAEQINQTSAKPPKKGFSLNQIEEYIRYSHLITYVQGQDALCLEKAVSFVLSKEVSRGKVELVDGELYRVSSGNGNGGGSNGSGSSSASSSGNGSKSSVSSTGSGVGGGGNSNSSSNSSTSVASSSPSIPSEVSPTPRKDGRERRASAAMTSSAYLTPSKDSRKKLTSSSDEGSEKSISPSPGTEQPSGKVTKSSAIKVRVESEDPSKVQEQQLHESSSKAKLGNAEKVSSGSSDSTGGATNVPVDAPKELEPGIRPLIELLDKESLQMSSSCSDSSSTCSNKALTPPPQEPVSIPARKEKETAVIKLGIPVIKVGKSSKKVSPNKNSSVANQKKPSTTTNIDNEKTKSDEKDKRSVDNVDKAGDKESSVSSVEMSQPTSSAPTFIKSGFGKSTSISHIAATIVSSNSSKFPLLNSAVGEMLQTLYDLFNELDVLGRPKEWEETNKKLDALLPLVRELVINGNGYIFYGRVKELTVDGDIFVSRISDLQEIRDDLVQQVKSFVNGKLGKLAHVHARNNPIDLLCYLYENHPPSRAFTFDAKMLNGTTLKSHLKKALLYYHPDKQSDFHPDWKCLCEAICRCLTDAFQRFH